MSPDLVERARRLARRRARDLVLLRKEQARRRALEQAPRR